MAADGGAQTVEVEDDFLEERLSKPIFYSPEVEEAISQVTRVCSIFVKLYFYVESNRLLLITPYGNKFYLEELCLLSVIFQQVFKSDDPLDSKDFNPVDYINSIFPTEQVCFD